MRGVGVRSEACRGLLLAVAALVVSTCPRLAVGQVQPQLPDLRVENVSAIAISPDGRVVATGERTALVKLWNAKSRQLTRTLEAHVAPVSALVFSPDGSLLASGGFDRWIRLWDINSGQLILALSGPGHVKSLAFSGDGQLLASSGADGARVWDLPSGELRNTFPSPRGVLAAVFSPDRTLIAAGGGDGIRLWSVTDGTLMRSFGSGDNELTLTLAFSPNGQWLASGGTSGTAKLWETTTGTLNRTSERGNDFVRAMAFTGDGTTIVVADRTGARAWSTDTGAMRPVITDARFPVVAVSSDGRALGAPIGDDSVKVLSLR